MKKIFLEPTALIDIYNGPCIRVGAELPVSYALSVMAVGGMYASGYYAKAGVKAYNKANLFVGLTGFVKNNINNVNDNIRYYDSAGREPKAGSPVSYDVARFAYGGHIEVGGASRRRHWMLEWYAGAGVRVTTVRPTITDDAQSNLYHHRESMIDNFTNSRRHNSIVPSITLGIRTGYAFGPYGKHRRQAHTQ